MPYALVRQIHPVPGREDAAIAWYKTTEPFRMKAGQLSQVVLQSVLDHSEYQLIQIWTNRETYETWKRSDERQRLAVERNQYMTSAPAKLYRTL